MEVINIQCSIFDDECSAVLDIDCAPLSARIYPQIREYVMVSRAAGGRNDGGIQTGTHHIQVQVQTQWARPLPRRTTYHVDRTMPGPEDPFGDYPAVHLA